MITTDVIWNTSEKLISTSIVLSYLITGTIIEQCKYMHQMFYTPNDIAYQQDND